MRDSPHASHSQRSWSINALQYCDVSVRCWDEAAKRRAVHSSDEMRTIASINDGHVTCAPLSSHLRWRWRDFNCDVPSRRLTRPLTAGSWPWDGTVCWCWVGTDVPSFKLLGRHNILAMVGAAAAGGKRMVHWRVVWTIFRCYSSLREKHVHNMVPPKSHWLA